MSFTMELAAAWALSPVKAVRDRRRAAALEEDAAISGSPTRSMDFPMVDEPAVEDMVDELEEENETLAAISTDRSVVIRKLAMAPLDFDAPQEVTPIPPCARQRSRKIRVLPTLGEQAYFEEDAPTCVNTVVKPKKKTSHLPKPSRSEKIKELIDEAVHNSNTGDEDEAIKIYKKAIKIADVEVAKLKGQLNKSLAKHPLALASIQTRIQEDMLELVLLAGKIKIEMAHLYERQGDYDNAIETCKEARSLYRKQRKRSPQPAEGSETNESGSASRSPAEGSVTNESGNASPDSRSCNGSKGSSDSDRSIVWYVACPDLERLIRSSTYLLERLTKAHETYEDRKKMIEEILMLRQEIGSTIDVQYRRKLYAKAESMAKNAVAIESATLGELHPQVANTLQLLAALTMEQQHDKRGRRDQAIQYLLKGLGINLASLGPKHPRTGQDLLRMARLYQQPVIPGVAPDVSGSRQDEDRSIQYFTQAAEIFRGVKRGHKVVGSILNDVAVIYVARKDYRRALELLNDALSSYEAAFDEEASESDDMSGTTGTIGSICIDVVQVWRNMGECHMNLREFSKAIEAFVNALEAQREARQKHDSVSESESDDLDSAGEEKSFLVHLMLMINDESIADTLRRLGKAFAAAEKYKEAMVVYREALHIHRTGVNDALSLARFRVNPEVPGKQDQLANTMFCIAEVCLAANSYADAIRIFNDSMQLRIASDAGRPENQRCNMVHCAMCLVGIANVHFKKHEYVEAHKLYNNALFFCEAQGLYR
jgi:tetratricopeptide (TPR) repeat protein